MLESNRSKAKRFHRQFIKAELNMNKVKLSKNSLNMKRLELVRRSRVDLMIRKLKYESLKEIQQFKYEEMKKIDSDIKIMKHDMMSFMLKEIEDRRQKLLMEINEEVTAEKNKRRFECELKSKNMIEKSVQTLKYPITVNEKFDAILKELKDIKSISSSTSKTIISNDTNTESGTDPQEISSEKSSTPSSLHKSEASIKTFTPYKKKNDETVVYSSSVSGDTISTNSNVLLAKGNIKSEISDDDDDESSQSSAQTESQLVFHVTDDDYECFGQSNSSGTLPSVNQNNHTESFSLGNNPSHLVPLKNTSTSSKSSILSSENVNNRPYQISSQMGPSIKKFVNRQSSTSTRDVSINQQGRQVLYQPTQDDSLVSCRRMNEKQGSTHQRINENQQTVKPSLLHYNSTQGPYMKNNCLPSFVNVNNNVPKIKSYKSLKNHQYSRLMYESVEPSEFTSSSPRTKYSTLGSYDIYEHNKKLINSQQNRGNCGNNDIMSLTQVRKKRDISKRVLEKYGPIAKAHEVCEKVEADFIFLSLAQNEKEGILSCIQKSVAERSNFAKDLLEELFSREALSISSCKGSTLKTALDPDRLEFIRRIVFTAMPSLDEESMWNMIQECIDTKCRGILRNMKKKLKKSFEY